MHSEWIITRMLQSSTTNGTQELECESFFKERLDLNNKMTWISVFKS